MNSVFWHLTWRTYGTRVPGEAGFVGNYRTPGGARVTDNAYGTPTTPAMPALAEYARGIQLRDAILLDGVRAERLLAQLLETCRHRAWTPQIIAILMDHIHLAIALPVGIDGDAAMGNLKADASRALNRMDAKSGKRQWWARGGSARVLQDERYRKNAGEYIGGQEDPLLLWDDGEWS